MLRQVFVQPTSPWSDPHISACLARLADYEAAAGWFDAAFALSAATHDLLAAANMRVQVRSLATPSPPSRI